MNIHIIKYAKGHYGESDDVFRDLSVLISKYSGWDPEGMPEKSVIQCVQMVWEEVGESINQFPLRLFEESLWPHNKDKSLALLTIELMLSNVRFIDKGPKGELLNVYIPKNYPGVFFGSDEELERLKKLLPDMINEV